MFSFSCSGNHFFHIHDSGKKTGLVNLSIKRIWKVIYTYWGFVRYDFVCFFISATRVHPSSYLRNGCHLSSKIWDGENCCICSVNSSANRTSRWPGCCSCSLPHKRISLPGMLYDFEFDIIMDSNFSLFLMFMCICNCCVFLSFWLDDFLVKYMFLYILNYFYNSTDLPWIWEVQYLFAWH